jgi:hypothetical protein
MPTASANTLSTGFNAAYWTPTMQETFFKESVALGIASTELRADLRDGDTLHKPYSSYPRVQTYTKGTDITVKDIGSTDDYLTVSTAKVASFYVDDIDRVQNKYDAIKAFSSMAMKQLNNVLDQAVINAGKNAAATTLTGASIGEAAGPIVLTAANVANVFTAAARVLNTNNRTGGERFALIGPRMLEVIQQYVGGRETGFGDTVSDNGKVASRFGFGLRLSNNLPFTATLTTSGTWLTTETVTINGVTFTAKTAAATAGDVDLGANPAAFTTLLVYAINDDSTAHNTATTWYDITAENRQLLESAGIVATDNTTSITLTGYGDIVVSETCAEAANVWSVQYQYGLMGQVGSIDLVTQVTPNVVFRDAELRLGKYVHPWMLYGVKVFERMKGNLVSARFDASSWV